MLFNSPLFIFAFLPIVFIGYFLSARLQSENGAKLWLVAASLFFYSWWNIIYLPLILGSILFNFAVGSAITKMGSAESVKKGFSRKAVLTFGIVSNIALLAYYKYMDFFISNANAVLGTQWDLMHIVLPLGISFFTFTQIAYLIDSYGNMVKEKNFFDYTLFVTFFPHLLAGPILHHKEMMPQFANPQNRLINYDNIALGLFLFSIGLFKKVVIADTFAQWANAGFETAQTLNMIEAWATSLSYTFQLYFDFSGYTDMALGIALLFNIKFPQNFNSPYRALNVIDFWSRWHMTLTRFLTAYIYEPIVRSFGTFSFHRAMFATVITMLIAGLWHGAAWTFVVFGLIHGVAIVINHYWKKTKIKLPVVLAWILTFSFLNTTFVIFRAEDWNNAMEMFMAMSGANGIVLPELFGFAQGWLSGSGIMFADVYSHIDGKAQTTLYIAAAFLIVLKLPNTIQLAKSFETNLLNLIIAFVCLVVSFSMLSRVSEFLYFNF